MNGQDYARAAGRAFRQAFPETEMPIPSGHLREQSRFLLRSGVEQHIMAGYYLHGLCEAMEGRHG